MPTTGLICSQCNDATDIVTPLNGSMLLAKASSGEIIAALHTRCTGTWAQKNDCETLMPLKKMRRRCESSSTLGNATQ
jgi:hypothetical protein